MVKKQTAAKVNIPGPLVEAVKNRQVIPFFGAGASKEARNAVGEAPPDADQLRDILAMRFFGREMKKRDVMSVAEMAIKSSGGRSKVFEVIRQALDMFEPGDAHRLVSTFCWRMLATTNYDLLIERAYESSRERRQNLVD